jgi:16S rRNA (uracil1498-N3)-methyltransferase
MSERFYINWPLLPGPILLEGPEAHHLATVCRLRPGDAVCLFNGDGHEYPARIVRVVARRSWARSETKPKRRVAGGSHAPRSLRACDDLQVELQVDQRLTPGRELPFRLVMAAPLPKGDRAQFLVEKLTEFGVTAFVPLATKRSVVHPRDAKLDKLKRYVIEASKQCRRNVLMEVRDLVNWDVLCREAQPPQRRFLAHPGGTALGNLNVGAELVRDVAWAIGPEGGLTDLEVQLAAAAGWRTVDFGPRVLRVETAALTAAAWSALFA